MPRNAKGGKDASDKPPTKQTLLSQRGTEASSKGGGSAPARPGGFITVYPKLQDPAAAAGETLLIRGSYWDGTPAEDRDRKFGATILG
jgi:hypothetical protein